jgi:hypothetical protein
MTVYANPDESGQPQSLPSKSDNTRGYLSAPLYSKAADPQGQYEIVKQSGSLKYWRVNPEKFLSDSLVDSGVITAFKPQEVHKFTVVIWLEGDDPHCTNELIGGHWVWSFIWKLPSRRLNKYGFIGDYKEHLLVYAAKIIKLHFFTERKKQKWKKMNVNQISE